MGTNDVIYSADEEIAYNKGQQDTVDEIIQLIGEQAAEPKHHGYKDVRNDELAQLTIKILKKYRGL